MALLWDVMTFLLVIGTFCDLALSARTRERYNRLRNHRRRYRWNLKKYTQPSYFRNVHVHSRFGHYLAILENGEVKSTWDPNSPDAVLEMSSYGVAFKRIRRPGSHYLAIDEAGHITTRPTASPDTLFKEHHGGNWMWYKNDVNKFILAFKRNGKPRDKVTNRRHKAKTQFLIIPLCGTQRCLDIR